MLFGGHCEPLHLFPDWLRPLHRLTMEMLAQEKRLYSGAWCESAEGVVAAANFRICLSLNGGNCWELPVFQIVAWKRGGGGAVTGSAEHLPTRQHGEVTAGWSWLGS